LTGDRSKLPRQAANRWPQRWAWVLACATFLLISAGGTVTTYDVGLAIRDWPTAEGHWFYPLPQWLAADWDVFLEQGHRMLAQGVGLIGIALAAALWRLDGRRWIRWLGVVALAGLILQGTLGGLRVLGDDLWLAKVHGCTAPLCFACCAVLVTLTSRRWQEDDGPEAGPACHWRDASATGRGCRLTLTLTLVLTVALYLQIVLGAQIRHLPLDSRPGWFVLWVWLKLIVAGLIALGIAWLLIHVWRTSRRSVPARQRATIVRRAGLLAALFFLQLLLGAGTWVTNFGLPGWFKDYVWGPPYTVVAAGRWQVVTTTAHAAVGSLTLAAAFSLWLWSRRLLRGRAR
jgi:cytochrome c oxidase assembly protein subunit 15